MGETRRNLLNLQVASSFSHRIKSNYYQKHLLQIMLGTGRNFGEGQASDEASFITGSAHSVDGGAAARRI